MPSLLLDGLLRQPDDHPAVLSASGEVWNIGRLLAAACRIASMLRAVGCAGRPVLLHARSSGGPLFAAADLGVLLAHGVPAVVPEHLTPDQAAAIVKVMAPAAVVDTAPTYDHPVLSAVRTAGKPVFAVSPKTIHWPGSPASSRAVAVRWAAERRVVAAAVVFTSGTTGTPRGVVLRENDLVDGLRAWSRHWPVRVARPVRTVAHLPVAHVAQRIVGHYLMCVFGTTVHCCAPELLAHEIIRHRPDVLLGVPHTWSTLATAADHSQELVAALGGIGLAVNGGAALDRQVAERLAGMGLRVCGAYGATETTVPAFHQPDLQQDTLGDPVGVDYRIAADGELLIRSPFIAAGYVTTWPHTRPVTDEAGWLRTGDGAHPRDEDQLLLAGRVAAAFKTGKGRLVHPEPAEALLVAHPQVAGACLVADQLSAAALVSAPATSMWSEEQIRALERELAAALVQAQHSGRVPWSDVGRVHVVPDSWPRAGLATSTGKPRRAAITDHYAHLLTGTPDEGGDL